jgi:hypothetical protein
MPDFKNFYSFCTYIKIKRVTFPLNKLTASVINYTYIKMTH